MKKERFTTIRVPVEVKEQAEKLRKELKKREEYKWLGNLALGSVISYALSKILEDETDGKGGE